MTAPEGQHRQDGLSVSMATGADTARTRGDPETSIADAKKAMRKAAKAILAHTDADSRARASAMAAAHAQEHPAWKAAGLVLAFLSMPDEMDTTPVIAAAFGDGKRVAVPRMDGDDISFVELDRAGMWTAWQRDRWNIPVPPADTLVLSPSDMTEVPVVALIPGLAFDAEGGRLGRGKGYYDRFLASVAVARATAAHMTAASATRGDLAATTAAAADLPPFVTLGYGYTTQRVARVPVDTHDIPLDGLVTG